MNILKKFWRMLIRYKTLQFVFFFGIGMLELFVIRPLKVERHHADDVVYAEIKFYGRNGIMAAFNENGQDYTFSCGLLDIPNCELKAGYQDQAVGTIALYNLEYAVLNNDCYTITSGCHVLITNTDFSLNSSPRRHYSWTDEQLEERLRLFIKSRIYFRLLYCFTLMGLMHLFFNKPSEE